MGHGEGVIGRGFSLFLMRTFFRERIMVIGPEIVPVIVYLPVQAVKPPVVRP